MMRFPRSIRWRLQLWYGALLVVVLGGFGLTAFHFEKARRFRRIDAELQTRLSALVDALRAGERSRAPAPRFSPAQSALFDDAAGHYFAVWMQGAQPIASSRGAPAGVPKPGAHHGVVRTRGELREAFIFAAPVNCALVGRSIATEEAELRTLGGALAAIAATVLGAGLLVGGGLVARAIRPVEDISAAAARIAAGDLSQRIATETDSELGQLADVLNSTFARLEDVFVQQAQFTADAAHELRTPVSVLLTQTQSALARERSADEYRETLEACQRAAQRMRRLIESLLALAGLDAGQEPLLRAECDLATIAADCLELVRPLAAIRRIRLHAGLSPTPCRADAERFAQVVTNLLTNAIDYNCDGGEVRIATERTNGTAMLTVSNTGPGISAEDLPRIFDRFHRADTARTGSHGGLGLAIAMAIVRAHGGTIAAASTPGGITSLTVKLPA